MVSARVKGRENCLSNQENIKRSPTDDLGLFFEMLQRLFSKYASMFMVLPLRRAQEKVT